MLSTSIWMRKMLFALNKMKNRKKHHKNCAKHLPSDKFQQFYNSTFFFIVTVLILLFSYIIWWHCAQLIARKRIWKWKLSIESKITCQKDEDIIIVISNQYKKEPFNYSHRKLASPILPLFRLLFRKCGDCPPLAVFLFVIPFKCDWGNEAIGVVRCNFSSHTISLLLMFNSPKHVSSMKQHQMRMGGRNKMKNLQNKNMK